MTIAVEKKLFKDIDHNRRAEYGKQIVVTENSEKINWDNVRVRNY